MPNVAGIVSLTVVALLAQRGLRRFFRAVIFAAAAVLLAQNMAHAAITYVNSASNPADNGTLDGTVVAVTPPGGMQTGDLVILVANAREAGQALAISNAGGQTWTSETANTTTTTQRIFWARYNGTWGANPSVSFPAAANATTVVMHVFRPTSIFHGWAIDVALTNSNFASPPNPRDVTIGGITTVTNGALVLATWATADDNTWGLQTAGWSNAGNAQYRNRDGADASQSSAYMIMPVAGATGDVVNRQTANGGDAGNSAIIAFREVAPTFYTRASTAWNTGTTWSVAGCGGASAAASPTAGSDVVICTGHTVPLDTSTPNLGSLTIQNGGTLNIGNSGTARTLTVAGDVNNSGTLQYATAAAHAVNIGGQLTINGGGMFTSAAVAGARTLSVTGLISNAGTFRFAGTAGMAVAASGGITNSGTFDVSTASNVVHVLNVGGDLINTGTVLLASDADSLVNTTFNGTVQAVGGSAGATFNDVTTAAATTLTLAQPQVISGALTLGSGTTLNAGASNHAIAGNFTNNGGTLNPSTGTFTFNGAAQAIGGSTGTTFNNLTTSGAAAVTVSQPLTINGNLTLGGGSTYTAGASAHAIAGNFINNGAAFSSTGTFTFNGGSAQVIGGTTASVFNNLTINSAGVTLGANATAGNVLTLTSGVVTTGANVMIATANCPGSVARTAGHVAGFLRLRIPVGSPTCVFPVGDATGYRPVTIAFTTVANTGTRDVTASVTQSAGEHPNIATSTIDPALDVNRYWTISNNTTSFASAVATFDYLAGDADAGTDQTIFIAGRFAAGAWSYPSVSPVAGSAQVSGLLTATLAGDYVLGENPPVLFSHWRMDQTSGWSGAANEVTDSGVGAFHGVASGLVTRPTTAAVSPAIAGSPGTCRYGVFNRSNKDYVALPAGYPNLAAAAGGFTITAWINTTNSALPGQRIFIDDENNTSPGGWGFSVGETTAFGAGGLRFYYRQGATFLLDTVPIPSNQWLFVALSVKLAAGANASSAVIYAYDTAGTLVTTISNTFTWTAGTDPGASSIGGETNASTTENTNAFGFSGSLDEVRVYQQALSQGRINLVRQETHPCATLDHFNISHATTGVACDTQTITITAHDSAHNPVSAGGLAVNLSTSNARGTWTGIVAGGGVLSDPVAGDGAATYTFAAGSNSVQLSFRYANLAATSESFNFNVSGGGFTEATGTANLTDDPVFTMSQAGFRFRNITDASDTIPTQIAGKPSNTGFNAKTIRIQAIKTDTVTGACTGLFASQTRTVELGGECNNPATCAARQVSINGSNISTSNNNAAAGAAAYTGVSLSFNAGSEADTVIVYPDAGQISLHARYDLDPAVAGYEMTGSSGLFVVRPFGMTFPGIAHSNTGTGTLLGAAGDNFSMTVRAYQWAAGEDADNDGIPDAGANITDNGTVPNFAATATVSRTTNLPGIAAGTVSRGATCASAATIALAGGTATAADWCYSEAGNVILTADVNNYITAGVNITGNSGFDGGGSGGYVGRFRPKRFALSGASRTNRTVAACAPSSAFTYMNEGLTLAYTLTAQNAQGATTQNYTGVYAKHDPTAGGSNAKTAFDIGARNVSPFAALTARISAGYVTSAPVWSNGVLNVTGGNAALVTVGRPTPDDPPDGPYAQVQFGIAPTDSDGVLMAAYDLDADNNAVNERTAVASTTALRYGRMRLGGVSGSQLLAARVPVEAQYWNGTFWIINTDDNCTTLAAGNVGLGNYIGNLNAGETTATITASPVQAGRTGIQLSAPGAGNNGSVDVAVNLGAGATANACPAFAPAATAGDKAYLRGKWCGATATRDPAARVRFGIQRGSNEEIYTRENTN